MGKVTGGKVASIFSLVLLMYSITVGAVSLMSVFLGQDFATAVGVPVVIAFVSAMLMNMIEKCVKLNTPSYDAYKMLALSLIPPVLVTVGALLIKLPTPFSMVVIMLTYIVVAYLGAFFMGRRKVR